MKALARFFLHLARLCDPEKDHEALLFRHERLRSDYRSLQASWDRVAADRDRLAKDSKKWESAHDRITNELAHYIATAYSR